MLHMCLRMKMSVRKKNDIESAYLVSLRRSTNQGRDCDAPCKSLFSNFGGKTYVAKEKGKKSKQKTGKKGKNNKNKKNKRKNRDNAAKDLGKLPNLRLHFSPRIQKIEEHYLYTYEAFDECLYNTLTNLMKNITEDNCTAP